jgi:hypothetical protein
VYCWGRPPNRLSAFSGLKTRPKSFSDCMRLSASTERRIRTGTRFLVLSESELKPGGGFGYRLYEMRTIINSFVNKSHFVGRSNWGGIKAKKEGRDLDCC